MAISPEELGGLIGICSVGCGVLMLARAWARHIENHTKQPPSLSSETAERIERMERNIDAVAVEVERISEGQRFVTRLLSERGTEPVSKTDM